MKVDRWKYRRRLVFGTVAFCAGMIAYLAFYAPSDPLREQIALGLIGLAGAVITGYTLGAVWDDRNLLKPKRQDDDFDFPSPPEEDGLKR